MRALNKKLIGIGVFSYIYLAILSAKQFTWVFQSGDSGDWLASAKLWFVPQAFGSPLYISLAKLVGMTPFDLPIAMTAALSAIPSTITILLVFLIVKKLTDNEWYASVSSLVLLASVVFLSQSTIVEEYALSTMFLTLAFYMYILGHKKLTALSLGLGMAVHIFILPVAVLWLAVHYRTWREWVKPALVFAASGILPYTLILYLMASDAPQLFAGGLSWESINGYLGGTYVVGSLGLNGLPERGLMFIAIMAVSLGLAWIPISKAVKPLDTLIKMMIMVIGFSVWYYLTNLDFAVWTYLIFGMPFLAILTGIGLSRMSFNHLKVVAAGAFILLGFNAFFFNADIATRDNPQAQVYFNSTMRLPEGSAVISDRYGFYPFTIYYAYAEGKDIIPLFMPPDDSVVLYDNYLEWVKNEYDLEGENIQEITENLIGTRVIYILPPAVDSKFDEWQDIFEVKESILFYPYYYVVGVK